MYVCIISGGKFGIGDCTAGIFIFATDWRRRKAAAHQRLGEEHPAGLHTYIHAYIQYICMYVMYVCMHVYICMAIVHLSTSLVFFSLKWILTILSCSCMYVCMHVCMYLSITRTLLICESSLSHEHSFIHSFVLLLFVWSQAKGLRTSLCVRIVHTKLKDDAVAYVLRVEDVESGLQWVSVCTYVRDCTRLFTLLK